MERGEERKRKKCNRFSKKIWSFISLCLGELNSYISWNILCKKLNRMVVICTTFTKIIMLFTTIQQIYGVFFDHAFASNFKTVQLQIAILTIRFIVVIGKQLPSRRMYRVQETSLLCYAAFPLYFFPFFLFSTSRSKRLNFLLFFHQIFVHRLM